MVLVLTLPPKILTQICLNNMKKLYSIKMEKEKTNG